MNGVTDTDDLKATIATGDAANLALLPADVATDDLGATLTAMANGRIGGRLLIGVKPVSPPTIEGVPDSAATIDRVLQIALAVQPSLFLPVPQPTTLDGRTIVVAQVPPGMPHVYSYEGRYYLRKTTQNRPLTPSELRRLFIERGDISFEMEAPRGVEMSDLDENKIRVYAARMGESDADSLLLRRGCALRRDDGTLVPTNAGLLLFGKEVTRWLRGAEITAVRFAGTAMSDTFTRHDISGTVPEQVRAAETFLRDHMRKGVRMPTDQGFVRSEQYEYPMEAVRELVVNAVAHRDYSIYGDGIRLYMFKDRMEITSPGKLPGPVTVANIRDERFSRNPALVQVLADMGFIERLGYGVDRVIDLMQRQSLRAPEFTETSGGFRVSLSNLPEKITAQRATFQPTVAATRNPTNPAPEDIDLSGDSEQRSRSVVHKSPEPIAEAQSELADLTTLEPYRDVSLNPRQETALRFLSKPGHSRITNSELQRLHPDVHAETIRRDLSDLVTKDILVKMGEKRGSYYVLKSSQEDETTNEQKPLL